MNGHSGITYLELAESFLKEKKGYIEESSLAKYEEMIYGALKKYFGDKQLDEITVEEVRKFVRGRDDHRPRMMQEFCVLNMMMTYAVNKHIIERNPCDQVALPKKWRKEAAVLRDAEIKMLEEEYREHPYGRLILFMIYTGLRIGEALALTWSKVDWDRRKIRINWQIDHHYDRNYGRTVRKLKKHTKNKVDATIYLCDQAMEILEEVWDRGWSREWIFTKENGEEIKYADFYYQFNKIMEKIHRPDITPHSLRHTAATTILYCTKDAIALKDYLRDRGLGTSIRYAMASEHEQQELADVIDNRFGQYITKRKAWVRNYDDYKIFAAC